jgi:hypothetical protein
VERYRDEMVHLRNALRDVQDERKGELREVVEGMEGQIERLNFRSEEAEKRAVDAEVVSPSPTQREDVDGCRDDWTRINGNETV